jgi:LPS-assembly protein
MNPAEMPFRPIAIAVLLTLSTAASLVAQGRFKMIPGPKPGGGEVKWEVAEGGRVEFEKDEYALLENDVKVTYQDISLKADKVTLNLKTKDAVAEGHVIIDQGPTRVSASRAVYNLDSKTGTFFKATATMEPEMYVLGDEIEKVDVDTYRIKNGVFTSCDLDDPAWSFHVGSAVVRVDDYAHMRNISFRAKHVPVFWAPRLVWPTKRDRSRGFLIPRVLFSGSFGTRLETGYFIPIGPSADATVYADLNTKSYFGTGVDVRYLPNENIKLGEVSAYTVRDPVGKTQQWKYQVQHAQENLPGGFRGVVDVQDYSNLDFFRSYDRDPRLHTLSNIYSSAYLTKNRSTYSVNILADRREILLGHATSDPLSPILNQRFEQLPALQLRMYPQRVLGMPLYFSLESSSSHLRTSGLATGINGGPADYYRTDLFPTVSLQLRTPAWMSVKPQVSVRETLYSSSLITNPSTGQKAATGEAVRRFYGQGQLELVGPSFSRVFQRSAGGFSRFKHVIEPRVRYVYTTNVTNQDRLIRFDTVDSPFLPIVRDSVEYSVTQRIIGKEAGEGGSSREVLSFGLKQTVSLSKPFPSASGPFGQVPRTADEKFTPLEASLHFNPYQSITLDAGATLGNVSHQIDQSSLSANLVGTGKHSDKYLSFTWFAAFEQPVSGAGGASQLRVNGGSGLWQNRLRTDVQVNYDASTGKFLEQRYLLGGNGSCYGIALEYRHYLVYTPEERSRSTYGIAVTLKNVGTIGTH